MHLIYNGKVINETNFQIDFNNRAFNYGDGVFETIIVSALRIRFLSDHWDRLTKGVNALGMRMPANLSLALLEGYIKNLAEKNHITSDARIKLLVWRKVGGLFSPTESDADFLISASSISKNISTKKNVRFYDDIKLASSSISPYKTLSALPYVMAGIYKNKSGADDIIFSDIQDHIAECLVSNIFWIKKDVIYTPSIDTGCVAGVMRKQIISFLEHKRIPYQEGKFTKDHLLNADFVFTSNVTALTPIHKIGDKNYASGSELFSIIQQALSS